MSDETVIVDKIGTIFLGGPPLVKVLFFSKNLCKMFNQYHVNINWRGLQQEHNMDYIIT